VDTAAKTMSLKNVQSFGTEGRRNGVNEVAASENILGMVKFKVELIKEFNIVKQETQEDDPAILEQVEATEEEKNEHSSQARQERDVGWAKGVKVNRTGVKDRQDAAEEGDTRTGGELTENKKR